ncbi:hypothetical protein KFE25_002057 [Diacronema lutheri]|uniref:Uncharacterized protein n=1 Tax=Diacronema lutheri TaxID=2081491 RepID=A0A8J5XCS6_DIALT|nr:hypothetical protein KFE25_002057 [Diacronema lutheri]
MGQRWSTPSWPDEIFVVDCPRQKLFENIFMPSSVNDWLDTGELQAVEAVRDNDVAPGLLLKLKTEDATAYIEWTRREYDVGGIGEKIRWNFYWIGRPPPPEDVSVPSSKNTHTWVKKEATVKYTAQFTLSDPPNAPGRTKVLRETFDYTHSATLRFPFWATHRYLIKPDHSRLKAAAETMWKDGPTPSQVAMSTPWPWNVAE